MDAFQLYLTKALQWHNISIMASQITDNSTVCSTVQADNEGTIQVCIAGPFLLEPTMSSGFPSQRASNIKSISMSWHLHGFTRCRFSCINTLIARFMGPAWGPSGADRTQVGPCWTHELYFLFTLLNHIAFVYEGPWDILVSSLYLITHHHPPLPIDYHHTCVKKFSKTSSDMYFDLIYEIIWCYEGLQSGITMNQNCVLDLLIMIRFETSYVCLHNMQAYNCCYVNGWSSCVIHQFDASSHCGAHFIRKR